MSHRFWFTLALSLAAVVLLSQTSSAQTPVNRSFRQGVAPIP